MYPLSAQGQQALRARLVYESLPKGSILLEAGAINTRLYYVVNGIAHAWYKREGKLITSWFSHEEHFIISSNSFLLQQPSYEAIELLTDAELISIEHSDLEMLYQQYPEVNSIVRLISQQYLLIYEERVRSLRCLTAVERYERFAAQYPELLQRIPLQYIATFLGTTPQNLSRIRRPKKK